jgi:hypothetical protein
VGKLLPKQLVKSLIGFLSLRHSLFKNPHCFRVFSDAIGDDEVAIALVHISGAALRIGEVAMPDKLMTAAP